MASTKKVIGFEEKQKLNDKDLMTSKEEQKRMIEEQAEEQKELEMQKISYLLF